MCMGQQTTIDSYSAAVASGAVDAWVPEERTTRPTYPTVPPRATGRTGGEREQEGEPERFTTFGFVEYRPRE